MARAAPLLSLLHVASALLLGATEGLPASQPKYHMMEATAAGDVVIGGIFNIHEAVSPSKNNSFQPKPRPCIRLDERGLVKALSMINAVEVMNRSPLLTAANVTLGYRILDSCSDVSTALRAAADFMERPSCRASACDQPIMAAIGGSFSEISITIARQLTLKMIPQISYSSTAVILSDKSRFPAFLRTVPNDMHQTAAMVSLLRGFGWSWVGIVTTDGDYGRSALDYFLSQASEMGICVAFRSVLPQSVNGQKVSSAVRETAAAVLRNPKAQVVVSFAKPTHMKYLFLELKKQALRSGRNLSAVRRVWVASDSWSSSSSLKRNVSLQEIGRVLGFTFKSGDTSSFGDYLSRVEAGGLERVGNNSFLTRFLLQLKASKGLSDGQMMADGVKILKDHMYAATVFSVEMAVRAIAQAVAFLCKKRDCKTPGKIQPWEMLAPLRRQEISSGGETYRFDSGGDLNLGYDVTMWRWDGAAVHIHDVVAEYHPDSNDFSYTHHVAGRPFQGLKGVVSRCSESCLPGEFKKTTEGQHTCCYECINCTENHYSNQTDMDQCLSCDAKEWSLPGSERCTPKELRYFSWRDRFAIVLVIFSALGVLLAALVSALFLHWRHTPVVRAAGGPLSQVILGSLAASYASAVLFVGRPNDLQCKARQVLFGLSFTVCVSCVLVKTLQILLAFHFDPALQQALRRLFRPYVIVGVCVALQVATCICWLVIRSPSRQLSSLPTSLLEDCDEGSYLAFGVMLGYIALLALVCFVCAFKGRKLPEYYNEAKFITFSMLLYLISWMLFVPVYVTTKGVYLSAVEMVVILISNYGILCCHFLPKCYVIIFKKEQNTASAFRQNVYEYSSKSSESVSGSAGSEAVRRDGGPADAGASTPSVSAGVPAGAGPPEACGEKTGLGGAPANPPPKSPLRRRSI